MFILAGGQSKSNLNFLFVISIFYDKTICTFVLLIGICIYHVGQTLLVKKFEVTQNRSFDAMDDVISRKKLSEFGNLALIEDREDPRGKTAIK